MPHETSIIADPRDGMPLTPDWSDDGVVYVDGRLTRNRARHAVCDDTGGWYKTSRARRVWMVYLHGEAALEASGDEYEGFWWVVPKGSPGALSMWAVEAP